MPEALTVDSICIDDCNLSIFNSTSILSRTIGWHSGIRSEVRLAAVIPAIRATVRTSPLAIELDSIKSIVSDFIITAPMALAIRTVTSLSPTSTIFALPLASR